MKQAKGLLWKDWKLSVKGQILNVSSIVLLWLVGLIISFYYHTPNIVLAISLFLIVVHLFSIATDMFMNLNKEMKLKLWFHTPVTASAMLLSKAVISLINCLLTLTTCIILYVMACLLFAEPILQGKSVTDALAFVATILGISIYLGVWTVFFWSLLAAAKSKSFKVGRYALHVLLFFVIFTLHERFITSPLFEKIQAIGSFKAVSIGTKVIQDNETYHEVSMRVTMSTFSIASLVVFLLIATIVFFLTQQNMKKVEG